MINKIKYVLGNKTIHALSFVTVGNIFNAGLGFIALIVVSRALGPENFGIFSVIFGFFALLSKMGDFGTNQSAMRYIAHFRAKGNTIDQKRIVGFFIGVTYVLIGLSALIFFPTYKLIADFLHVGPYSSLILLAIIFSFAFVMFNTYAVIFQSYEKFTPYVLIFFLVGVFKLLSVFLFSNGGSQNITPYLLIYFLSPLIGYLLFYYQYHIVNGIRIKPNLSKKTFLIMTPFIYYMAINDVTAALAEQVGVFTSSMLLNSYQTGLYSAALKLSLVFNLIAGSIGTVLIPKASKYSDYANIQAFAKKAMILGVSIFACLLPIAFFPEFFITITSGSEFIGGATALTILTFAGGFTIMRSSFTSVFYSLERADYFAATGILNLLFTIPIMYILGKSYGINGIALASLISSATFYLVALFYYFYLVDAKK